MGGATWRECPWRAQGEALGGGGGKHAVVTPRRAELGRTHVGGYVDKQRAAFHMNICEFTLVERHATVSALDFLLCGIY